MNRNAVLSFSGDSDFLAERELALRNSGFEVVSVRSESEARFEIEMGRCGNLLICSRSNLETIHELAQLFKKYCPDGCILLVTMGSDIGMPDDADYVVLESEGPEAIVQALSDLGRSRLSKAS